jgi:hypothetical protein
MSSITLDRVSESFQYPVRLESEQSADPDGGDAVLLGHLLDERIVASEQRAHISAIKQRSRGHARSQSWYDRRPHDHPTSSQAIGEVLFVQGEPLSIGQRDKEAIGHH